MGQALRIQEDAVVAEYASVKYRSREVPGDWYVDPADPQAADRYIETTRESLEDEATAFLAAHEALVGGTPADPEDDLDDPPMELRRPLDNPAQPVWIGLPRQGDFDDEGELGWQTDQIQQLGHPPPSVALARREPVDDQWLADRSAERPGRAEHAHLEVDNGVRPHPALLDL